MMRCVLVATDGSEPSIKAVQTAIELASSFGPQGRLHVASVVDYVAVPGNMGKQPAGAPDLLTEQANGALQQAQAATAAAGMDAQMHLLTGDVVEVILACAAEVGADLLVAGMHGRNRLARLVIGSVTGRLVRTSQLPIVVVR
jgi:nucleotide-binding universal stress UspA family protein